jgi:hypothetical protein
MPHCDSDPDTDFDPHPVLERLADAEEKSSGAFAGTPVQLKFSYQALSFAAPGTRRAPIHHEIMKSGSCRRQSSSQVTLDESSG